MRAPKPPALATWLLDRPGVSRWQEGLSGDLIEEYGKRRSAVWYWRQVLEALSIAIWEDLRCHWILAFRALAIALLAGYASGELLDKLPIQRLLIHLGEPLVGAWPAALVVAACHEFIVCALAARAAAWTHRARQALLVASALLAFQVWWSFSNFVSGRGRPDNLRMLLLSCGFTLVMLAGALVGGFAPVSSRPRREIA